MKNIIISFFSILLLTLLLLLLGIYIKDIVIERWSKLIVLFFVGIELLRIIKQLLYNKKVNEKIRGFLFSVVVLLLLLFAAEGIMIFVAKSHFGFTKCAQLWFHKNWKINSFGFRDKEPESGKPTIFFVGDSFTAGHGIDKPEDRYSNIVATAIKTKQVLNLGVNGYDTKDEYNATIDFISKTGIKPKTIVLQYYANDIVKIAAEQGVTFEVHNPLKNKHILKQAMVNGSHLVNYFYWSTPNPETGNIYMSQLQKAYDDKSIRNQTYSYIDSFVNYAKREQIELLLIIFPLMNGVEFSKKLYCDDLMVYAKKQKINCIDVSALIKNEDPKKLVVNNNDGHPSVLANRLLAGEILNKYIKN